MNRVSTCLSSLAILTCLAAPALAADITVVGWGGTWDKAYKEGVWEPYMKATDNKIIMEEWGGELAKIRAQVQSGSITYDVVSVEAPAMDIGCAEGLFVPLAPDVTGPADSYLEGTLHECGVASDTWATILAYSKDAIPGEGPKSWADYFDTKKFPGKRGMLAGAQYTLENALMGDGVAPADVYKVLRTPEGVDRAFKKLDSIKSDVVWWTSTTQAIQNLTSGEVVMTDQYNARITNEIDVEKKNYAIVWEAGFFYGTDFWAVVKGAPNEQAGVELLKWFSVPKNQAGFSRLYAYGTGRKEAADHIPAEQLAKLPTSPEHLKSGAAYDGAYWTENKEALEARFKAWLEQ
jgi:putative spermidine/putrescine transport system substrate-binding protein